MWTKRRPPALRGPPRPARLVRPPRGRLIAVLVQFRTISEVHICHLSDAYSCTSSERRRARRGRPRPRSSVAASTAISVSSSCRRASMEERNRDLDLDASHRATTSYPRRPTLQRAHPKAARSSLSLRRRSHSDQSAAAARTNVSSDTTVESISPPLPSRIRVRTTTIAPPRRYLNVISARSSTRDDHVAWPSCHDEGSAGLFPSPALPEVVPSAVMASAPGVAM